MGFSLSIDISRVWQTTNVLLSFFLLDALVFFLFANVVSKMFWGFPIPVLGGDLYPK